MTDTIDFYAKRDELKKKSEKPTNWRSLPIDEDLWYPNGVLVKEKSYDGIYHYCVPMTFDEVRTLNGLESDDIKWLPLTLIEMYIEGENLPPILG